MSYKFLGLINPPRKNSESFDEGVSDGFHVCDFNSNDPSLDGKLTNPQPCM